MLKFTPRRRLTGGLRLPAHKERSTAEPILRGLIPKRLFVSMRQHRGKAAAQVVDIGQCVQRGQVIARTTDPDGADVHAPSSGRVVAVERRAVPLGSGLSVDACVVIETDGSDDEEEAPLSQAPADLSRDRISELARAGIVGLGGAVFPTAAKLRAASERECRMLIINGAECEPYISCDDMLMREAPEAIVRGARSLKALLGAPECIIAIERDKPQAIDAITAAAEQLAVDGLRIAELPSIYPAGGERQLVEVLTGVEVPSKLVPGDAGFLCQNVGTAYAIDNYFTHGKPLTSRIVTISGAGVAKPRNVEALIGTPVADLIEACGGYRDEAARLIHGGSMMGYALPSATIAVTKSTNCIIVAGADEVRQDRREWPCIRCGECAIACPARLQPQDLLLAARADDAAELAALALDECIECGCCDVVCPSHILLTETFRQAKPSLQSLKFQRSFSAASEARYQRHEQRREEARRTQDQRREDLKLALQQEAQTEIRAAVERARQRKPNAETDGS
jgi:electron transport complex protein RnfC